MPGSPCQFSDRIGRLIARLFLVAILLALYVGIPILFWCEFGWMVAIFVCPPLIWHWLTKWLPVWKFVSHPRPIGADSLFGASFECPTCGQRRFSTVPCFCGHKVTSIEWEYPGRIKAVK